MKKDPLICAGWSIEREHWYDRFPIFSVKRSTRRREKNGQSFDFVLLEGLDWVNVIALTPDNQVVLINQFRHGSGSNSLEIPGGVIEAGEVDPRDAARREFVEETGYQIGELEFLQTLLPNPAMMSMRLHCYVAFGATSGGAQDLDPGEDISVLTKPISEVYAMISRGELNHALVVAAFSLFQLRYPNIR